jgi:hypothetical protein
MSADEKTQASQAADHTTNGQGSSKEKVTATSQEGLSKQEKRDIKYREEFNKTSAQLTTMKVESEAKIAEMSQKVEALENSRKMSERRAIESEVKALAISEGLTDTDLLKLVDTSKVSINEAGELQGAKEAVAAFKTAKPNYFETKKKVHSSPNISVGTSDKQDKKTAFDIPEKDWKQYVKSIPHGM